MDSFWLGFGLGGILGASAVTALTISDIIHRIRGKIETDRQIRESRPSGIVIPSGTVRIMGNESFNPDPNRGVTLHLGDNEVMSQDEHGNLFVEKKEPGN